MNSMQWQLRDLDPLPTQSLARALSISPITAAVLRARGIENLDAARSWLSPDSMGGCDPFELPDMEKAVDRLSRAIQYHEKVCFYGDYDVDGISATSLYLNFFSRVATEWGMYIPQRMTEGYGLNASAIRTLARQGVSVLVTADCGTSSHAEILLANSLGMDVIVTDHHQIQDAYPEAVAFLNPQRPDARLRFRDFCSGGLAYKVAEAFTIKYGGCDGDLFPLRDLVALATIADVVPLQDENRLLVRHGLAQITAGTRCGIRALKQVLGVEKACTAGTVGFRLAPVINAAGRLADAKMGVQLLTTTSDAEAMRLSSALCDLNRERREIEQAMFEEAVACVGPVPERSPIIVGSQTWHVGVVGIVAARLVERYHCPAIVVSFNERGIGRGSARSVPGVNICQALEACRDLLEGFGGHEAAAGLTVREDVFPGFQARLCAVMEGMLARQERVPVLKLDAQVHLNEVNPALVKELEQLHPFGMGNPEPTFLVAGLTVLERRVVGDDHLKLVVRHPQSAPFQGIGFRMGERAGQWPSSACSIDLACVPEMNHWQGYSRVQLRIRDIRVTEGTSVCQSPA